MLRFVVGKKHLQVLRLRANTCQREAGGSERERPTDGEREHTEHTLPTDPRDCQHVSEREAVRLRPAWRVGRTGVRNHLRYLLKCEPGGYLYRGSCSLRLERGGHLYAAELWL